MQWGTVGEWIAALAGVIAVAAAIAAALYTKRTFDRDSERENRTQAGRFSAWPSGFDDTSGGAIYGVTIANHSDSMIYKVSLTLHNKVGEQGKDVWK